MSLIQVKINNQAQGKSYIGWSPQPCSINFATPQSKAKDVEVIADVGSPEYGSVVFLKTKNATVHYKKLKLTVPKDGSPVDFFIAGDIASTKDQDTSFSVRDESTIIHNRTVMVRIRKNANKITDHERDRFLQAIAQFNLTQNSPNYKNFLDMHNAAANAEIHGRPSFLVWHRGFVLDLERQLQKFDASVTIPYWKFDEPAPNVFTADFMGASLNSGSLQFSSTNPLISWTIAGRIGIVRKPIFDAQTQPANVMDQAATMALGTDFTSFRTMEDNPHGSAHVSFYSPAPITNITIAPQDPIFFMLHCNVDRLWAYWQMINTRYNLTNAATYPYPGAYPGSGSPNIGDYLNDTMWPWNGMTTGTRPPTAPGGPFPQLAHPSTPSPTPEVWEMIDYQGYMNGLPSGADYDDIKYKF